MTEHEKLIADLGKPKLGDRNTIRVRIRESKEFKVDQCVFYASPKKTYRLSSH